MEIVVDDKMDYYYSTRDDDGAVRSTLARCPRILLVPPNLTNNHFANRKRRSSSVQ